MNKIWSPQQLTLNDQADFEAAAKLLDAGSQYHTDNVPEVFDDKRIPKSVETVRQIVEGENTQFWVVKDEGVIIGIASTEIEETKDKPGWRPCRYGYVHMLFVDQQHRDQGAAKALMEAVQNFFKEQNLTRVELNVWQFNAGARELFDDLGYTVKNTNLWKEL